MGQGKLILTDISDSLGRARVYQSSGAWTSLDYLRASCIDTGTVDYYNPTLSSYETYRVIEITMIKLTFAGIDFRASGHKLVEFIFVFFSAQERAAASKGASPLFRKSRAIIKSPYLSKAEIRNGLAAGPRRCPGPHPQH
jgi:hypothetical protein